VKKKKIVIITSTAEIKNTSVYFRVARWFVLKPKIQILVFDGDIVTCLWQPEGTHNRNTANIILISAYWSSNDNQLPALLPLATEFAYHHNYEIICCIDSNAHSTLWGPPRDDHRGHTFEQFQTISFKHFKRWDNQYVLYPTRPTNCSIHHRLNSIFQ
jgi:hypothetical protein